MKKTASFVIAVLALLACQKEVDTLKEERAVPTRTVTITARLTPGTKTAYDEQGKFSWVAGDQINMLVVKGDIKKQVPFTTAEGGPEVHFTGEVEEGFQLAGEASYALNFDPEKKAWILPDTAPSQATASLSALPLFGLEAPDHLYQFKTAVGILQFTVENIPVETASVSLETFGDEAPALCGSLVAAPEAGVVTMSALAGGGQALRAEGGPQEVNTTLSYCFFVPAGTLPAQKTRLCLLDASQTVLDQFVFQKDVEVQANRITRIAALSLAKTFNRQTDSLALVKIYEASDGANWAKNNWKLDKDISTWSGVTLTGGRVTALKLTTSGTIVTEWTLPEEVGELKELAELRINGNKLTGALPESLFELSKLQKLYFQNNNLTGELSAKIGQLTELTELYIDRNTDLGGNLEWIGQLTKLVSINIAKTAIGGVIPGSLVNCKALKNFMAYENKLSGEIPDFWDQLPSVGVLQLYDNPGITGPLPSSIGSLVNATGIQLKNCNITGNIPASFGGLTRCGTLMLNGNKMSGFVPAEVQAHPKWLPDSGWKYETNILPQQAGYGLKLASSYTRQTDSLALVKIFEASDGANWAKNNWKLDKDMSTWNGVTLTGGRVTALKLTTSGTIVTDWTLPEEVGDLAELTDLRVNGNKLTGALPESLFELPKLQKLYFQNNNLTGELSAKIAQLSGLTELYIDRNTNLGGNLEWIGQLTKLVSINIAKTAIGGAIPESLVNCKSLKNFMAYENKLSGEIPDIWDQLTTVGVLQLYDNPGITGPLPSSIGSLVSATGIQLKNCNITGNIPASFGGLTKCSNLMLSGNKMSGVVPAEVQAHPKWLPDSGWKYETNILPQQEGYGLTLE